ncbi:MAG: hypothetical protein ACE5JB_16130, partial [bacterium]
LGSFNLVLDTKTPEYKVPAEIKGKATELLKIHKKAQKNIIYDSTTIRLNDVIASEKSVTVSIAKAHYFDYLATNFSMDAKLNNWKYSLRDQVHKDPCLCKLKESLLANHFGVGALVFTIDNFLVLPVRSKKGVNIRRGQISPSISGASNFDRDVVNGFSKMVFAILREGAEELGIETNEIDLSNTHLLA